MAASLEDLERVPDVGPVVAASLRTFFDEPRNRDLLDRLRKAGVKMEGAVETPVREAVLAGQTFVLTGTLSSISRDEARRVIEELGGKVVSSVIKKTSFVIVGTDPGSTFAKAEALGVPTLDEGAFAETIMKGRRP